jgi:hypothetical protein
VGGSCGGNGEDHYEGGAENIKTGNHGDDFLTGKSCAPPSFDGGRRGLGTLLLR